MNDLIARRKRLVFAIEETKKEYESLMECFYEQLTNLDQKITDDYLKAKWNRFFVYIHTGR